MSYESVHQIITHYSKLKTVCPQFLLRRFRATQPLVIVLDELSISGWDLVFLSRANAIFRRHDFKTAAQFEFDVLQWINDLLGQFPDFFGISRILALHLNAHLTSDAIEFADQRIIGTERIAQFLNLIH